LGLFYFTKKIMRFQKYLFVSIILFAFFQTCFGQEKPKAELIDEFGLIGCEGILSRIDNFMVEIMNEPNSIGYAVIYGKQNKALDSLRYESWINGNVRFRGFDVNRLVTIRGKEQENLEIELWRVPAGVEKPFSTESKWNLDLSKTKPFVFFGDTYYDGICPGNPLATYAELLLANQTARGHIVFQDKTDKNFRNQKKEVLDKLVNYYKIPRHRLKLFYDIDKNYPHEFINTQYWLVPRKKK
jgi:hypothetical protein